MSKIETGNVLEDFTFDTPFEKNKTLYELVSKSNDKTALLFLRYYGCTLCQMDIHYFIKDYAKIKETGSQLIIVLQSKPESINQTTTPSDFPFEIICDQTGELYEKYEINPGLVETDLLGENTMSKIERAIAEGFEHGEYEGNELQLPAYFILDKNSKVLKAHYGAFVDDTPSVNELVELFKN